MEYKNSNKPLIIFLYGVPGVGKLTVAREIEKLTGFKVLHNHMILDLVFKLFSWKSGEGQKLREKLYYNLTKMLVSGGTNTVYTHMHAKDFIYPNGLTDLAFVNKIKKITESNGGVFYPVQLICNESQLHKRVIDPSRKHFTKTSTIKGVKLWRKSFDFETPLAFENNLVVDTTSLSARKAAKFILGHCNKE